MLSGGGTEKDFDLITQLIMHSYCTDLLKYVVYFVTVFIGCAVL